MKRREIEQQIEGWIKEMEAQTSDRRTGRAISVNTLSLKVLLKVTCFHLLFNW
jgi:hypothetical protein